MENIVLVTGRTWWTLWRWNSRRLALTRGSHGRERPDHLAFRQATIVTPLCAHDGDGLRCVMPDSDFVMVIIFFWKSVPLVAAMAVPMRVCVTMMRMLVRVIVARLVARTGGRPMKTVERTRERHERDEAHNTRKDHTYSIIAIWP